MSANFVAWVQDVTEENAELALGVKANKGLIPAAATPTGTINCSSQAMVMALYIKESLARNPRGQFCL